MPNNFSNVKILYTNRKIMRSLPIKIISNYVTTIIYRIYLSLNKALLRDLQID